MPVEKVATLDDGTDFYVGLSSDTKPAADGIPPGSTFYETDTFELHRAAGGAWGLAPLSMTLSTRLAGERNTGTANEYQVGVDESEPFVWAHNNNDVTVTSNAAMIFGYSVNAALTGDFALRNGTSDAGDLIHTAASNAPAGTVVTFPGVKCSSGIFIDDNASAGEIALFYREQ